MNIGIIGVGNMTCAILTGLLTKYETKKIHIMNRTPKKTEPFIGTGVNIYPTALEVIENSDVIILGLKPNQYEEWLKNHQLHDKVLISIAAGMSSKVLKKYVEKFVITMPNTPAKVQMGTTLIVENEYVTAQIINIFTAIGTVKLVTERELDKYMLVTGCSPAYFFSYVDILASVLSEKYQLDQDVVEELLVGVLNGSGEMLKTTPAQNLTENVCSPGGVTIEIINALKVGLKPILEQGFTRALIKNEELTSAHILENSAHKNK